jgi:hypothetical protein
MQLQALFSQSIAFFVDEMFFISVKPSKNPTRQAPNQVFTP